MTILSKLFGKTETKAATLTDPAAFKIFGITPTSSGTSVGPKSAMHVPAVACAVSLIAESVATMPAKAHIRDTKDAATNHPAYKLIHDEANEWTSAGQLREDLTTDALLHGNGYAQVVRLSDDTPAELHRLEPSAVSQDNDPDGTPFYRVMTQGGERRFEFQDILHIQSFGGVSPIVLGREAIGLAMAYENHIGALFKNGARPSGIIKSPKSLDVESKKKVAASWFNTHGGSSAGKTAILDEDMTYEQISMTLADAQFAENRLEQTREIARLFRVPPTMLFELTRGTWSNTEEMARQFRAVTLRPWLSAWEWAYARCLFSPEERQAFYVEFVTDDLLTTDTAAKATALGQYRSMGVMTANEVRAILNKAPHPDGDTLDNPHITTPANSSDQPDTTDGEAA